MATVIVDEPPEVTEAGLKAAVAPVGRPEADRFTVWAVPPVVAVATVAVADWPGWTDPEAGVVETEKSRPVAELALAVSLKAAAAAGAETVMIGGKDLMLPMYNPYDRSRSPEAARLVDHFRRCDGLIIASPAYHGSLSGLMKNALDYAEDLRDHERVYFDGVAVGLVACAGGWQAAGQTLAALRSVAHALRGWPTPLGATLNTATKLFDDQGQCLDLSANFQLETVGQQVVQFSRMRHAMLQMKEAVV